MATSIPIGSALAKKVYSVGLFTRIQESPGFMNLLSGPMPQTASFAAKMKGQTSSDYPVVKAGDLSKTAGDVVSVDLFNVLQGKPVVGDKRVVGKMMPLTYSSMDVRLDQVRGGSDSGGKMAQQRTVHNLRGIAMAGLQSWAQRYEDQLTLVHLAGARGSQNHADWVVPLASDADFASIAINTIKVPTKNRQFYANDATVPSDIGTNDWLTFKDIDRIITSISESTAPLQTIKIPGDGSVWDNPLWAMFVTERQWLYLQAVTSQTQWRQAVQNAYERKNPKITHPLFDSSNSLMWQGMLIRRLKRYAIRFNAADVVVYDTGGSDGGTYTEANSTVAGSITVDRAIIVGAQALAKVYGRAAKNEYFYDWNEEETDHGNVVEIVAAMMTGVAKTSFKIDNVATDYGVAVLDSYAPDPNSAAGRTVLNT